MKETSEVLAPMSCPPAGGCHRLIEELDLQLLFWQYFGLYGSEEYAFLLDSALADGKLGRYSFLGGNPGLVFRAKRRPGAPSGAGLPDPFPPTSCPFTRVPFMLPKSRSRTSGGFTSRTKWCLDTKGSSDSWMWHWVVRPNRAASCSANSKRRPFKGPAVTSRTTSLAMSCP